MPRAKGVANENSIDYCRKRLQWRRRYSGGLKNNENQLKELKIKNAQYTYELVQMDRAGKVADMLEMMGSEVETPHKPADILKK